MAHDMGGSFLRLTGLLFLALFLLLPLAMLLANFTFHPIPVSLLARNFFQAFLSASFALLLSLPLAFALAKNNPISKILNPLTLIPLMLPQPAMILSLAVLFGANGYLLLPFPLYGFEGIVLAHSLYNFPLSARIIASRWSSLRNFEGVARTLGAGRLRSFLYVTLPSLKPAILSAFAVAFAFSFTSFSIPLVFGGVSNTTMEVEIFRNFFRDFNLQKGIFLASLQLLMFLPIAAAWRSLRWGLEVADGGPSSKIAIALSLPYALLLLTILLLPFLRVRGAAVPLEPALNSLALAASSATLSVLLWVSIGERISKYSFLLFAVSPAVLAVAYYNFPYSPLLLVVGHALLSFALVSSALLPLAHSLKPYRDAAAVLGASPLKRLVHIDLRLGRRAFLLAFLFAFGFSLGETAFLSSLSRGFTTMSLYALQAFSAYRFGEGHFYSLVMIILAALIAILVDKYYAVPGSKAR